MVRACSAYGCANNSEKQKCREKHVSFHRFPLNDERRLKLWLAKIKRKDFKPNEHSLICSEHFGEDDFMYETFTNRRLLKKTAYPKFFCFTNSNPLRPRTYKERLENLNGSGPAQGSNHLTTQTNENVHFGVNQYAVFRVDGEENLRFNAVPTIFNHIHNQCERKEPIERNILQEKRIESADKLEGLVEENSTMPSSCSAYGCRNSSDKAICREKKISFHRFPVKDEKKLKLWLESMNRKSFILRPNDRICSEHFYNSDFKYQQSTNRRVLLKSSVPTKFYVETTKAPGSSRTSNESESSIVQDEICETEMSSKEKSIETIDISAQDDISEAETPSKEKSMETNDISTQDDISEAETSSKEESMETNDISTQDDICETEITSDISTQDDICETEITSKEQSTQTNDISTNHLLAEIEKLKAENSQLKTDLKKITEYVAQLLETL